MRTVANILSVVILGLILNSCSRVDLAIKWADTFLYYELKSIFDFEGKQKAVVETATDDLVAEMKKDWLPAIADRFQALSEKVDLKNPEDIRGVLENEVAFITEHLKKMYLLVGNQVPAIARVIHGDNWTSFKDEFEEKNLEILDNKDKSKLEDNIERFLGDLSQTQQKLIRDWLKENPPNASLRVENRRHIIKEMDIKVTPWTSEKWSDVILTWLKDPEILNLPSYKSAIKKRTDSMILLLVDVLKSMSDEQRGTLKNNLLDWKEKIRKASKVTFRIYSVSSSQLA